MNYDRVPHGLKWMQTLSFFHAAYEALLVNELRYLQLIEHKFGLDIQVPSATSKSLARYFRPLANNHSPLVVRFPCSGLLVPRHAAPRRRLCILPDGLLRCPPALRQGAPLIVRAVRTFVLLQVSRLDTKTISNQQPMHLIPLPKVEHEQTRRAHCGERLVAAEVDLHNTWFGA